MADVTEAITESQRSHQRQVWQERVNLQVIFWHRCSTFQNGYNGQLGNTRMSWRDVLKLMEYYGIDYEHCSYCWSGGYRPTEGQISRVRSARVRSGNGLLPSSSRFVKPVFRHWARHAGKWINRKKWMSGHSCNPVLHQDITLADLNRDICRGCRSRVKEMHQRFLRHLRWRCLRRLPSFFLCHSYFISVHLLSKVMSRIVCPFLRRNLAIKSMKTIKTSLLVARDDRRSRIALWRCLKCLQLQPTFAMYNWKW